MARCLSRTGITSDPPGVLAWLIETGTVEADPYRIVVLDAEWRLWAADGTYVMGITRQEGGQLAAE